MLEKLWNMQKLIVLQTALSAHHMGSLTNLKCYFLFVFFYIFFGRERKGLWQFIPMITLHPLGKGGAESERAESRHLETRTQAEAMETHSILACSSSLAQCAASYPGLSLPAMGWSLLYQLYLSWKCPTDLSTSKYYWNSLYR